VKDFWRVLRLLGPYKWLGVLVIVSVSVATIIDSGVFPLFAGLVFGVLFPSSAMGRIPELMRNIPLLDTLRIGATSAPLHTLLLLCAAILVAYVVRGVAIFASTYLSQYIAQRVMYTLRQQLYSRLLRLSLSFHDRHSVGEMMSRMTNDVMLIQNMVSLQLADAMATLITLVVGLWLMLVISWQLTALAVVLVPITGYTIARSGDRMRKAQLSIQQRLANLSARVQERLHSVRIIQSFAREDYEEQHFAELNAQNVEANLRSARILAFLRPLVEFMGVAGMVGGIAVAGWQVTRRVLVADDLATYLIAGQRVGERFSKIGGINLAIQQSLAAARRIFEILDEEPVIRDAPQAAPLPRARGHVRFRDLSFQYYTDDEVLSDINIQVEPGETIALVGPSGAGKSTLVNLLPRFYDPTAGAVEIDGHDLRQVTLQSLRAQVGIVPQDTILFGGSVYDNIRYGKTDASPEEVYAAARAANAQDFIEALAQGYESDVGERGLRLSGGQRQRIAIARALLKDPAILVLDEATSSLDMESEALVQEALERLMRGRTTFVIAHRLPTVRNADRILVLAEGRIIEQGSHDELLAGGGLYRKLYEMQFRDGATRASL
jgi:subfamily B ATP-binding cassette protein MsbA